MPSAPVVLDIAALRSDQNADVEWIDRGFVSLTHWQRSMRGEKSPQSSDVEPAFLAVISYTSTVSTAPPRGRLFRTRSRSSSRPPSRPRRKLSPLSALRQHQQNQEPQQLGSSASCAQCGGTSAFEGFTLPRPQACCACGWQAPAGSEFFGCDSCKWDICEYCHAPEHEQQHEQEHDTDSMAGDSDAESGTGSDIMVVCSDPGRRQHSPPAGLRPRFISSPSNASMGRKRRAASKKQCRLCTSVYMGFGTTCGSCRKAGPAGASRQCQECSQFFHGFGSRCSECTDA